MDVSTNFVPGYQGRATKVVALGVPDRHHVGISAPSGILTIPDPVLGLSVLKEAPEVPA